MMDRQPPLPPGLPPKPVDSYRPGTSSNGHRDSRRDPPMYHFGGSRPSNLRSPPRYGPPSGYDRFEGSYSSHGPPAGGYAPGTGPVYGESRYRQHENYSPNNGGNGRHSGPDVYHPQEGTFSFRSEAPPTIDFRAADSRRPRSPPRQRIQQNFNNHRNNSNINRQGQQGQRGGYRGRGGPRLASERDFLKGNRAPTPELMPGMEDDDHGVRYKPVEDLSDSEEAEMDMSDDEDGEGDQPKKKQARTDKKPADGNSSPKFAPVPKWSNPDPYTVLPPVDENSRKKKDVVKLIRKARVGVSSASAAKADGDTDDFISFDFGTKSDEENDVMDTTAQGVGVAGAPTGPRTLSYPHALTLTPEGHAPRKRSFPTDSANVVDLTSESTTTTKPMSNSNNIMPIKSVTSNSSQNNDVALPNKPTTSKSSNIIDLTSNPSLGSRKRNIRDEIKHTPTLSEALSYGARVREEPGVSKGMKGVPRPVSGSMVQDWQPVHGVSPTPWITIDHSDTTNMGLWLHKEIVDFYEFVKPRRFEDFIRHKLVEDLRLRVQNHFPGSDVLTFGSFPAGLYLPTADMDTVVVSDIYMRGGPKVIAQTRNQLTKFGDFVRAEGLIVPGSLEVISGAKVPLVKYVDRLTGLKVDISFENDTGLTANKTFQDWKATYPAMPILVTVIKHLLAMRGLNEPVNGGIGGFSITCLVVSLLQLMPQIQSRSMIAEHHLGEVLMEFLDLYGNEFNVTTTAIQFDPPGYVSKNRVSSVYKPNVEKFCIIDPNNSDNDIAGGSKNTRVIRKCFSQAFGELQKVMGTILGGNYESFRLQREHLAHLHERLFGPIEED